MWSTLEIPTLWSLRQEDLEFKTVLENLVTPMSKELKTRQRMIK